MKLTIVDSRIDQKWIGWYRPMIEKTIAAHKEAQKTFSEFTVILQEKNDLWERERQQQLYFGGTLTPKPMLYLFTRRIADISKNDVQHFDHLANFINTALNDLTRVYNGN